MQCVSKLATPQDATLKIIDRFCTPKFFEPLRRCKRSGGGTSNAPMNKRLRQCILDRVELFNADAATDEQLAGKKLKVAEAAIETNPGELAPGMPNIRIFNKDTTHSARRILSRTTHVDDFMKHVQDLHFKLRASMAQRIRNSHVFSERFRANIAQTSTFDGGRIKDLRAAKHRFESYQKPMGRAVLFHHALLLTAEQIGNERRNLAEGRGLSRQFVVLRCGAAQHARLCQGKRRLLFEIWPRASSVARLARASVRLCAHVRSL